MFKINPSPTFRSTVRLTVPGADDSAVLEVTWRHKGRAALRAWLAKARRAGVGASVLDDLVRGADGGAEPADAALAGVPADAAWLGEVMVDWAGPQDAQGEPVGYSVAALGGLLDAYPAAGGELLGAYLRAMTESRAKN